MDLIPSALLITLIGMGLVFIALLLLWGLMELMMRLTAKQALKEAAEANGVEEEGGEEAAELPALAETVPARRQAAAAAVAVALALKNRAGTRAAARMQDTTAEAPSAWQAVQRAAQLNKRTNMYSRKQRGSVR